MCAVLLLAMEVDVLTVGVSVCCDVIVLDGEVEIGIDWEFVVVDISSGNVVDVVAWLCEERMLATWSDISLLRR